MHKKKNYNVRKPYYRRKVPTLKFFTVWDRKKNEMVRKYTIKFPRIRFPRVYHKPKPVVKKQLFLPSSFIDKRRMGTIMLRETKNNIFATVVTPRNRVIFATTAGVGGMKGPKRATPYSAELLGRRIARKLLSRRLFYVDVSLKSELSNLLKAVFKGIMLTSLRLATINDEIAIAHNGIRPRKARRV